MKGHFCGEEVKLFKLYWHNIRKSCLGILAMSKALFLESFFLEVAEQHR